MQVNKAVFPATLNSFVELLETCDFYAFDEEMTGINTPGVTESITFSAEDCYQAKSLAASRYSMIQVGICLFHRVEEEVKGGGGGGGDLKPEASSPRVVRYVARPFNFILFPGSMENNGGGSTTTTATQTTDVVLSSSALAFLRRHGMDFQSWVYQGIAFCNGLEEDKIRATLAEKYQAAPSSASSTMDKHVHLFTDEERTWARESTQAAEDLLARADKAWREADPAAAAADSVIVPGGKEVLLGPQQSRNAREYLSAHLSQHLPRVTVSYRRQGPTYTGTLRVLSTDEAARRDERERAVRERELIDALGFRLVFNALVNSKKPCVGHNCFADILFLMAALDGPLPETLPAWKSRVSQLFPTVFDTKYLSSRRDLFAKDRFPARYLGGLYDTYGLKSAHVEVVLPLGFQSYDPMSLLTVGGAGGSSRNGGGGGGGPAHEAGYDALMTGTLLLNLLAEQGVDGVAAAPPHLVNKVALFRSLYAVDIGHGTSDEYLPASQGEGVLDLRHQPGIKLHHLEACLAASDLANATLYSVDETRTLALVPLEAGGAAARAAAAALLAKTLTSRHPKYFDATAYVPATGGSGGALRITSKRLMRYFIRRR